MKKFLVLLVVLAISLIGVSAAFAGYDMKIDEDTYAKFGMKAQIWYSAANPGPAGTATTPDGDKMGVTINNARMYFAGQVTNLVKFGFNYDFAASGATAGGGRATDALIMFDVAKEFKINTGIYRMAVSRVALQDSYQYILVHAPDVAGAAFLSSTLGSYRNGGVTVWGDLMDGMLRYNLGAWDGAYAPAAAGGLSNQIGLSGRLVLNFMDPEKGYTCPGCYVGKAKVANIGVGYFQQKNSADTLTYTMATVDGFYDASNLTLEAAYFMYDYDTAPSQKPTGWYAQAAYVIGDIQPAVRYESWDNDAATGDYTNIVAGVNYLISGQDAKVGLEWKRNDPDGGTKADLYTLQVQVQF